MSMPNNFLVVGYPHAQHYVNPRVRPDYALFDNEDFGFTAAIAADDAYEFAVSYAADVDLDNEVQVIHWMDFISQRNDAVDLNGNLTVEALDITFSMFNVDFGTANPANQFDDTNTLEFKKTFDGPYHFRCESALLEDDNGTPASHNIINSDDISWGARIMRYVPPEPIRAWLPLFVQFINRSLTFTTVDLQTAASDAAFAQASTEFIAIRIWYTKDKLSSAEKNFIQQQKFLSLAS